MLGIRSVAVVIAGSALGRWRRYSSRAGRASAYRLPAVEAFEMFVALALESEGLVVSEALKFPVALQTASGLQTHGFEVDLIGVRADRLVLATVKSYFGSYGVHADQVMGIATNAQHNKRYALLNNLHVRHTVATAAAKRFGYASQQLELRLYVGNFYGADGSHETRIRHWCDDQNVGAGSIRVVNLVELVATVRKVAENTQYRDNAALVAVKLLQAAGALLPVGQQ
jgi:hypothetical protein